MTELVEKLKVVLASTFAFYLKTHNFHWNVEGPNFPQYHEFLGELYQEIFEAIDPIAEQIRTLDSYTPGALSRFQQLSVVLDELNIPSANAMFTKLHQDNQKVIETLVDGYKQAEADQKYGLANFLQDRIDKHEKIGWKLRSTIKGV